MGKVASSTAFVSGVAFTTGHSNINEDSGCFSRCSVVGRGRSSIRGALDGRLATPRIGRIGVHKKSPRYHKTRKSLLFLFSLSLPCIYFRLILFDGFFTLPWGYRACETERSK